MPPERHIIIGCLGDSLTDGCPGYSSYTQSGADVQSQYQYWLQALVTEDFQALLDELRADLVFINRGACGEITQQIKGRLYPEIIGHALRGFGRKPDVIIIVGGTNDLGWGIGTGTIAANLMEMHACCRKEGVISMGASIPPTRFEGEPDYNSRKLGLNREIAKFFTTQKIAWADLYTKMGDASDNGNLKPALDAGDGLHFSVAGYRRMAEIIYEDGFREILGALYSSMAG